MNFRAFNHTILSNENFELLKNLLMGVSATAVVLAVLLVIAISVSVHIWGMYTDVIKFHNNAVSELEIEKASLQIEIRDLETKI